MAAARIWTCTLRTAGSPLHPEWGNDFIASKAWPILVTEIHPRSLKGGRTAFSFARIVSQCRLSNAPRALYGFANPHSSSKSRGRSLHPSNVSYGVIRLARSVPFERCDHSISCSQARARTLGVVGSQPPVPRAHGGDSDSTPLSFTQDLISLPQ